MPSAACATASGGTSRNRREAKDDRKSAAPVDRDGSHRVVGNPAAQRGHSRIVPAFAIVNTVGRLERGRRIWPGAGGDAFRGRNLVCRLLLEKKKKDVVQ